MQSEKAESFCIQMYTRALIKAGEKSLDENLYRKQIQSHLKMSKIPYSNIKKITSVSRSQWIEDLLQITKDIKLTLLTAQQYRKKLIERAKMHFTNGHKQIFSKSNYKNFALKNVIKMYERDQAIDWGEDKAMRFCEKTLSNTVYLVGLVKANGIIVENNFVVTCAHALIDEKDKIMNFKCFVTGNGAYGILKASINNVCTKTDVGIAKIVKIFHSKDSYNSKEFVHPIQLKKTKILKFKKQFSPIRCLQLGLLFNNESEDSFIKVFEAAEGFIERNLYENDKDHRLIEDMGLLVHDCYGLWGTSGSPLWTGDGELIGIHNAWNQNGYNVSMIVHDNQTSDVRVVRQYQRRAISVHVLQNLFKKWFLKEFKDLNTLDQDQQQLKLKTGQYTKKKLKLS